MWSSHAISLCVDDLSFHSMNLCCSLYTFWAANLFFTFLLMLTCMFIKCKLYSVSPLSIWWNFLNGWSYSMDFCLPLRFRDRPSDSSKEWLNSIYWFLVSWNSHRCHWQVAIITNRLRRVHCVFIDKLSRAAKSARTTIQAQSDPFGMQKRCAIQSPSISWSRILGFSPVPT